MPNIENAFTEQQREDRGSRIVKELEKAKKRLETKLKELLAEGRKDDGLTFEQELKVDHIDAWAGTFGEPVTAMELSPDGSGYRLNTRFARFINVPRSPTPRSRPSPPATLWSSRRPTWMPSLPASRGFAPSIGKLATTSAIRCGTCPRRFPDSNAA